MKKFNPDKELRRIENNNRNRIVFAIFVLLLIITIGSTYALYQVRHTNKLVFNTVSEFVKKDIVVSVLIDDESKPEFPTKEDGYLYSGYECENDGVITFDDDNWKFTLENNKPDKCVIKFTSKPFNSYVCKDLSMSECLLLEDQHTNKELAFDDPDGNARYIGATPSNYIWFNCDDYTHPTEETCERWRIIGSFKNIEKVNEDGESITQQNLAKIVKNESIGKFVIDNKDITTGASDNNGVSDWSKTELMYLLNPNNENHKLNDTFANNSLYWNSGQGLCSSGQNNATMECDFSQNGLKNNEITQKLIENVKWHLGGAKGYSVINPDTSRAISPEGFANEIYTDERGSNVYKNNSTEWKGKVALIYASDFLYATGGGSNYDRQACLAERGFFWNKTEYNTDCFNTSWIHTSLSERHWTLTHTINNVEFILIGGNSGAIEDYSVLETSSDVRPSLYLTHDTKVTGGDGTYDNPYTINVN